MPRNPPVPDRDAGRSRHSGLRVAVLGGVVVGVAIVVVLVLLVPRTADDTAAPGTSGGETSGGDKGARSPAGGAAPERPGPVGRRTADAEGRHDPAGGVDGRTPKGDLGGPAPPSRRVRLDVPWGDGPAALGRNVPAEGAPVGPQSLALGADGALFVLDNVNERIQVFPRDAAPRSIPLPDDTAQDLALGPDGRLAVLDRLRDRSVTLLDADGTLLGEVSLEGEGIPEAGGVTGVFAREDGVWAEVEHGRLVHVADTDGAPVEERDGVAGRFQPAHDRVVSARIQRPDHVILLSSPATPAAAGAAGGAPTLLAEVAFPLPVHHVVGLEFDAAGNIYLAVWLARFSAQPPHAVEEERIELVVLSPEGARRSRTALPAKGRPEEQNRAVVVSPDGIVYHLAPTDEGVVVREVVP